MRPVGYGRPGTPVIPAGWQATAGAVIEKTLDVLVSIGPAGAGAQWDSALRRTVTNDVPAVYEGAARLNVVGQSARWFEAAEDQIASRSYSVTLPRASATAYAIRIDHRITILPPDPAPDPAAAIDDPALWGRVLIVTGVMHDTNRFSWQLAARLDV